MEAGASHLALTLEGETEEVEKTIAKAAVASTKGAAALLRLKFNSFTGDS